MQDLGNCFQSCDQRSCQEFGAMQSWDNIYSSKWQRVYNMKAFKSNSVIYTTHCMIGVVKYIEISLLSTWKKSPGSLAQGWIVSASTSFYLKPFKVDWYLSTPSRDNDFWGRLACPATKTKSTTYWECLWSSRTHGSMKTDQGTSLVEAPHVQQPALLRWKASQIHFQ